MTSRSTSVIEVMEEPSNNDSATKKDAFDILLSASRESCVPNRILEKSKSFCSIMLS